MQPARLYLSHGYLNGANINRSPLSYLANPEYERLKYDHNTDRDFIQLNIFSVSTGQAMGIINWFAVHGTSMNSSNTLICGDNKGAASYMMEKEFNPGRRPGTGPFIAAFASANLGDASPNTEGPQCRDTGLPCDALHSTCGGSNQQCIAFGPGKDMFDSTWIIAERQFLKAKELFNHAHDHIEVTGPIGK